MCNETKLYLLYVYFHKGKKAIFKKRKFVNKSASNIILNRTKNLNSMNLLIVIFWCSGQFTVVKGFSFSPHRPTVFEESSKQLIIY